MLSKQFNFQLDKDFDLDELISFEPHVIFLFAGVEFFENESLVKNFSDNFKDAKVIGCSTAGEISDDGVTDKSLIATAIRFEKSVNVRTIDAAYFKNDGGLSGGAIIGKELVADDLKAIFVLGQGVDFNGSALIEGIVGEVGDKVVLTGGLAGDESKFEKTYTYLNGKCYSDRIVALGLYGDDIQVGYGSRGGWEPWGSARKITKAKDNILFELDNQPALEVYENYLGEHAKDLPASGLLYPLAILNESEDETGIIRTILGIDREQNTLILAGDVKKGQKVRPMYTQEKGLVRGAKEAAELAVNTEKTQKGVGILVSCVGRKLVMGNDTEEEVDVVKDIFGDNTVVTGFYSYGEICPFKGLSSVKLHNQTMTVTHLSEVGD